MEKNQFKVNSMCLNILKITKVLKFPVQCPLAYISCGDNPYSDKGLKGLSPGLRTLKDLEYTADEQRKEAYNRATKMSIQGVQPKLSIKRFDRKGHNNKIPVEDFAQLAGLNRDTKYDYSMGKVIDLIDSYCTFPAIIIFIIPIRKQIG